MKRDMSLKESTLMGLYGFLVVFVLWHLLALAVSSPALPPPMAALINLGHLILEKNLLVHLLYSLLRLLTALLVSLVLGASLGIALGLHPTVDRLIAPVLYILFPIPKVALLPILFLFFGLGELSKVLLIFLIIVFQIAVMTRDTVKAIPENIFLSARSMGLTRWELYRHVILPCISKAVLSALRISVGIGIAVLFFAENYATPYGIGFFIMNSWSLINYLDMYSGIVAMSLLGALFFLLLDWFEHTYCRWQT